MESKRRNKMICPCCMQEHEVEFIREKEHNIFKGQNVEYEAVYMYCEHADEYFEDEALMTENDLAMKNAYRLKMQLLTVDEIEAIRRKYGITQSDLCSLLGWGGKTITRYEGHQVQDMAHDTILRKLDSDPEWFLTLLENRKSEFSDETYRKYRKKAAQLYLDTQDLYLRKSIEAKYAAFEADIELCGGTALNLDKVIDIIGYFGQSARVSALYKVKLMKMLWYADSLSFKRRGASMTGLAYKAWDMGAVPVEYKSILELKGVCYTEIDFDNGSGYLFTAPEDCTFPTLSEEDKDILDTIIQVCGKDSKNQIIERMHNERAYKETDSNEIISFGYAKDLSIS